MTKSATSIVKRVLTATPGPRDGYRGTEERQSSNANCLGHYQIAGDYREGAGGEGRDTGSSAAVDVSCRSSRYKTGNQKRGRIDFPGEGRPGSHREFSGQDGAPRPHRRPQAFLEKGVRDFESRREAGGLWRGRLARPSVVS